MRIPLDQIHKPGLPVQADESAEWVTAAIQTVRGTPGEPTQDPHEDEGADSAVIALKINRKKDAFLVNGHISITLKCACDRCGASVMLTIDGDVNQMYSPPEDSSQKNDEDRDLEPSDLAMGWHDGQAMDLEMVLMEALALLGPDRVRCEDVCVTRIDEEGPCELPIKALEGGPGKANPFAALKLS
jgi:uncharacterized metal-binding protein YceD (DUF177 family)